ncbi:luciferin 4-monooxygenase-like [Prorops nasuta]|uniref:luciferin 4-monooxygenase-like n=1 Tax=Prorops nasuta TaxID=863751 RepID=UPI0034D00A8C
MSKKGIIISGPMEPEICKKTSLGQQILWSLRNNYHRIYQIDISTGKTITYGETLKMSVLLATALKKRDIKPGDSVAITSENSLRYPIPACATLYLGAIVAPINWNYTEGEMRHLISISKPKIIFVSRHTEGLITRIIQSLSCKVDIIQLEEQSLNSQVPTLDEILTNEAEKNIDPWKYVTVEIPNNSKQYSAILSSSGTTGIPKGVGLSSRNLLFMIKYMISPIALDLRPADKILCFVQYFHGYGFSIWINTIMSGSCILMMKSFTPQLFFKAIKEYRPTHMPIVPTVLVFLAKHPDVVKYDFSCVREAMCGAAPISKELKSAVIKRLGLPWIRNAYGMTELSVLASITDRNNESNDESVGYLLPCLRAKVVDENTGDTLDVDQVGEICLKGPQVMLGYYDNPEATQKTIDEDGWIHTGDIGFIKKNSQIYVVDRLKELIKYKGYQVAPAAIESILMSHSGVNEAAVVGKPDETSGELPMAFIVKQPGAKVTAEEIFKFVQEKLSSPNWLRGGIRFVEALPKSSVGKILRRELRKIVSSNL